MTITGDDLARERRRRIFRNWVLVAIVTIAAVTCGVFYKSWRAQSLHRAARAAMDRGDYGEAWLKAQWAFRLDEKFAPACVTLAEIGEHERFSEAVAWRGRVLEIGGESTGALLAYAACAQSFGKGDVAKAALDRVPEADRQREDFLVVAGAVASDAGDAAGAVRCYETARRINPAKAEYRLALGKVQIASGDYLMREEGRRVLAEMAGDAALGVVALRTLIANCEIYKEPQAALRHTQQLVALPAHEFGDELLRLRLLRESGNEGFDAYLAAVQQKAEGNPGDATAVLVWMTRAGLAGKAIEWALKSAPAVGQFAEVRPALAACHLIVGDWPALLAATQSGSWKGVEHVRHAYRAHAYREQGESARAHTEWNNALGIAAKKAEALGWLAEMASRWKWPEEMEQSLWALLEQTPGNSLALETLSNEYVAKQNTTGLRRIAVHRVKADPEDEDAQHDFAMLSLLLGTELERARTMAKTLCQKHPGNAAYATAHAFALHSAKRTTEGLAVLEALSPQQLEEPATAAYYGILLAANNSPEKALRFLKIGREASLLPEEKTLVEKAEQWAADSDR